MQQTFEERDVCRLRMRIIKTRTERGRPGTEARQSAKDYIIGKYTISRELSDGTFNITTYIEGNIGILL